MHVESGFAQTPAREGRATRFAYQPAPPRAEVETGAARIERGHSGEDVRALQRALNEAGAQPPLAEDGLFGPRTQAAVRRFQRQAGLEPNGAVDRQTLTRLDAPAGDDFDRRRGRTPRAPRHDQRAPEGSVPAGRLQQREDVGRRRSSGTNAPLEPSAGNAPHPSTTSTRASVPVDPPHTNSAAEGRSRETYDRVIDQFGVGTNPRYARRNGNTYCNIFASDVTRAMGAEIPHWVRRDGSPAEPFERGAWEMNANATSQWLHRHGERHGWRRATAEEAQRHANEGRPAVATSYNPGGIGHIAVVRPGELGDRGPAIAQAGARNIERGHVRDVWRAREPEYWVHE